jgi:hypothetical protein
VQCGHILSTAQERALGYRVTALDADHVRAGAGRTQRPRCTRVSRSSARGRVCASPSGRRASSVAPRRLPRECGSSR